MRDPAISASNDPAHVLGRTTLGSTTAPNFMLSTAGGMVNFKAGIWTQDLPHLAIFDATFIAENVFSGDAVDLEHKRNLYRVIIGKQGVTLAQQVNDIDADIRASTSAIKLMRAGIEGRVPAGVGFDAYVALAADPDVDGKIATKEKELEAVQQAAQLRARAALSEVTLPVSPADFEMLLGRTITDLSVEAERRVAEHLAAHEMEKTGERWIQEGLGYIRAEAAFVSRTDLVDRPGQSVSPLHQQRVNGRRRCGLGQSCPRTGPSLLRSTLC